MMAGYDLFFERLKQKDELAYLIIKYHKVRNKLHKRSAKILDIWNTGNILNQFSYFHDGCLGYMAFGRFVELHKLSWSFTSFDSSDHTVWIGASFLGVIEKVKYYFARDFLKLWPAMRECTTPLLYYNYLRRPLKFNFNDYITKFKIGLLKIF